MPNIPYKLSFTLQPTDLCKISLFLTSPFPTREKNPKIKTDLSFLTVYVLCNYCQGPKPFSNRGNFIAVVGQHCQKRLCSAIWWPQVGEMIDTKLVSGPGSWKTCASGIWVFYPVYEAASELFLFKKFLEKFSFTDFFIHQDNPL